LAEQRITGDANSEEARKAVQVFEDAYQLLKQSLLTAGAAGHCRVESMEIGLRRISVQRRALQQLVKAHKWMASAEVVLPEDKEEEVNATENTSF
jgi:hypothetical protein